MKITDYVFFGIALLMLPGSAYAYLDPGTGTLIVQSIIGAVAAALVAMKVYWYQIKSFFSKSKTEQEKGVPESLEK
jgi:hypothetical protein